MIWNLSPWWLFLAVAAVAVLAFIFSLGLNAIIGRDGFGPFGTMGIVTGGFFGSIYGVNAYGVRLSELQEAGSLSNSAQAEGIEERLASMEARLAEQEASIRHVLELLIAHFETDGRRVAA